MRSKEEVSLLPDETVLPDDYPIYGGYAYIADRHVYVSDWHGITVRELKARENFTEVRRCSLVARIQQAEDAASTQGAER